MESNTNPTGKIQKNPLQFPEISHSELFTEQKQKTSEELQQQFSEVVSLEQAQVEDERLNLQNNKRIGAADHLLIKKDLESYLLLQQLNQPDTEIQNDIIFPR